MSQELKSWFFEMFQKIDKPFVKINKNKTEKA